MSQKVQKDAFALATRLEHRTVVKSLKSVPTMPRCLRWTSVQILIIYPKSPISLVYTIPSPVESMGLKAPDFFRSCPAHTMAFFAHEALLLHESFQGIRLPSIVSKRFSCLHIHLTKQKMGRRCKNKGCCKYVRYPSPDFCSTHTLVTSCSVPPQKLYKKRPKYKNQRKPLAYFKNFGLTNDNTFSLEALQNFINATVLPGPLDHKEQKHGVRILFPLAGTALEEISPFLLSVVRQAQTAVSFPLKLPLLHAPVLVVAPPKSSKSNSWTKGSLHRDFDCIATTGVYSFLLFLDDVTAANGSVAFWRESKEIGPVDPRHPERALDRAGMSPELLLGNTGTVYVWDSRLLHRSLANGTDKRRLALQWLVTSAVRNDGFALSIST